MFKSQTKIFWFTVAWDGDTEDSEGEITHSRLNYKDMVESIEYYLEEYKSRDAYLECCSMESMGKSSVVNLTNRVKGELV